MRVVNGQIKLTPEEYAALEEAHKIVSERAEKENCDSMVKCWNGGCLAD